MIPLFTFEPGDHVQIAEDLGPQMSHFPSGCEAIVLESSGGSYALHVKGQGHSAWYCGHQLTLIRSGCEELLESWRVEEAAERARVSNMDWIFENGPRLVEEGELPGASVQALASSIGVHDMWGSHGEGYVWLSNAVAVLSHARPYLLIGDKEKWLEHCEEVKASKRGER